MRIRHSDEKLDFDGSVAHRNPNRPSEPSHGLLALQSLAGNAAVSRMVGLPMQRKTSEADAEIRDAGLPGGTGEETTPEDPAKSAPTERTLSYITMKRKHIHLTGDDKYGHWWTEMDGNESYGWWPVKRPVSLRDTLFGTAGELNGQTSFGGTPTRDPHHGDPSEDEFHPVLVSGKSDADVRSELRSHATGYSGEWRWTFGWGQNCHTFQEAMMDKIGLVQP